MSDFHPSPGYARIQVVNSFHELVTTRFGGDVNAICWRRTLAGDFEEVARQLDLKEGMMTLDDARLAALTLNAAGQVARDTLLEDQRLLRGHGLAPVLDCIHGYPRDEESGPVPTDVYSFHADSAPVETDTYLCSYNATSSECLRNDEAVRQVDIPETRAALLRCFGGRDDEDFREFLRENSYDLHYAPLPEARPFSFGVGNLWRIAVEYPGSPVPPCIHRAPADQAPRLLLIS